MFGGTGNSNSCGRTFERGSLNKGITIRQNGEGPTVETPEKVGHPYYFWGRPRLVAKKTKKSTCRHDRNSWFSVIPEKMCIYIYKYIYIFHTTPNGMVAEMCCSQKLLVPPKPSLRNFQRSLPRHRTR